MCHDIFICIPPGDYRSLLDTAYLLRAKKKVKTKNKKAKKNDSFEVDDGLSV